MQRKTLGKIVSYLGAAVKSGQGIDGVQHGPKVIRQSGVFNLLKDHYNVQVKDYGNIQDDHSRVISGRQKLQNQATFKNLEILDPTLHQLSSKIEKINTQEKSDHIMLTVGGDHSVATGTIHGMLHKYPKNLKVIWVDAHADILDANTTTYTGYHGAPLSHILGVNDKGPVKIPGFQWLKRRLPRENIVHIGWRQINDGQLKTMKDWRIPYYTPDAIDSYGIGEVMKRTLKYLDPDNNPDTVFHISFDIDGLDPELAPATGTTNRGGLTAREAFHIIRRTVHEKKLVSMDLVEINPLLEKKFRQNLWGDTHYASGLGMTAGMGVDLVQSLFNKGFQ